MLNYLTVYSLIITVALNIVAVPPVNSQSTKGAHPIIKIVNDYFYFGYMPMNAIVQHRYWIKNEGTDTLHIVKVKPGCGCTTAPLSKESIAVGDSAELKVIFDSKNMTGKMVKDVEIFSNDPVNSAIAVRFFGVVNREHDFVRAEPNTLRFSKFGSKDGKMTKSFEIKNSFDSPIEVSLVELPPSNFKIDKKSLKIGAGETGSFTLEQVESVTDENDVLTSVTFEFAGKETDRITLPIVAHLQR